MPSHPLQYSLARNHNGVKWPITIHSCLIQPGMFLPPPQSPTTTQKPNLSLPLSTNKKVISLEWKGGGNYCTTNFSCRLPCEPSNEGCSTWACPALGSGQSITLTPSPSKIALKKLHSPQDNGKLSIFNLHFKTKAANIQTINLAVRLSQQNLLPSVCFVVTKVY